MLQVRTAKKNRPVYNEVKQALADATARGQAERQRFLHRLRTTALVTYGLVNADDEKMSQFMAYVESKRLPESQLISFDNKLEGLRGISSSLRDLYQVMGDVVREEKQS